MASSQEPNKSRGKSRSGRKSAEQVVARNIAVESLYRKLIGLAIVATSAAIISVVAAMSLAAKRVPPQFVPVLADGRMLPLVPLDKPNMNQAGVANFTLEAIRALNTYDYINWVSQLNSAQQYFSPKGWKSYEQELMSVSTLKAVEARKMIVSVQPRGDVQVTQEGVVKETGVYYWRLEVPVIIRYTAHVDSETGGNVQEGVVTLVVTRVPTTANSHGVAIQVYKFVLSH